MVKHGLIAVRDERTVVVQEDQAGELGLLYYDLYTDNC
jgi:hypothetical protein